MDLVFFIQCHRKFLSPDIIVRRLLTEKPWSAVSWFLIRHLWAVFRKALALSSRLDDIHEPIGYRTATLIITGVTVLLLFFYVKVRMTANHGFVLRFQRQLSESPSHIKLENFKMVELIAVKSKSIFIATIFDIVLGSFGSFLLYLIVTYRMSGPHGLNVGREALTRLQWWLSSSAGTDYPGVGFMGSKLCLDN